MDEQKSSFKCNSPLEKEMMLALKSLFSGYVPEYYQQLAREFVDIAKSYGATETGEPAAALSQPAAAQGDSSHSAGGECGEAQVPLTDSVIYDIADDFKSERKFGGETYDEFDELNFARAIEAAHGIKATP